MKILIDNGHGIETPGKRSPVWPDGSQLFEWKYTREIARRVESELQKQGIDVDRIVKEDTDVSLSERCKRANAIADKVGIKNCLLVSIHNNALDTGRASGWEIHTYLGKSQSDEFATTFWNEAKSILPVGTKMRGDHSDGDPDFDSNFAILRDTKCPAVLTENLFMDNPNDCRYLLSNEGKEAITKIHVQSILKIARK
ncbi:MAG: N-acetylmuramoyl-L-alanine amidase [Prevotellaceae bacterium]|jgi:N-acetylmuramoyl-L-alanine amidase|nr:N-acetylmuramoyl-L-alanine amidase [Prevotellaceae bacterium]